MCATPALRNQQLKLHRCRRQRTCVGVKGANGLCTTDADTPACATRMHTWRRSPTSTWCCLGMSRSSCGRRWSGGLGGEHSAGPANRLVWSTVARTTNACPGVVSCLGHSCRAEQCAACPHKPCRQPVEEGSNAWDFWWGGNGQKFDFKLLQGGQCSIASGRRCTG